ncbi:DNA methyltransferase [Bradyrhizobium sp. Pa8]|uniref:DNA methyltransferase n=1 Tax=Bradyrhizobium sp. Pa8 TaxID=3386552 RepID=UPI00403F9044
MLQRLFTLQELEGVLKVSISTLRRAVRSGQLAHVRAGDRGQIRVSEDAVNAYLGRECTPQEASLKQADPQASPNDIPGVETPRVKVREGSVGRRLTYKILAADVSDGLKSLASESVDCAVTSPAYFWQRDYGYQGQIGHEATIQAYVDALVKPFEELRRVLKERGTFFLNIGDAYYNAKGRPHGRDRKSAGRQLARAKLRAVDGPGLGLPRKSLIGLPWRVALAMQQSGWTLRTAVIWERPGCLSEPTAHDRPHRTFEHVFMFSKGPKYFFDRSALNGEEDIWRIAARPENPFSHAAPYPIELVDRCLACGCPEGGVVLDPFLGSGTTAMSALRSGRSVIGIDMNESYCEEAERRILKERDNSATKSRALSSKRLASEGKAARTLREAKRR